MSISSSRPCKSICCKDPAYTPEGRCYWNASLFTIKNRYPRIYLDVWSIPKDILDSMVPGRMIPCPTDTFCYSDCNSGNNNIPTDLIGNGTTSIDESLYGVRYLTCSLDAVEHCFASRVSIGMEDVISVCSTYFDWLATKTYYTEEETTIHLWAVYPKTVSLLFLLVTFVIYTIIPELKNLHGFIFQLFTLSCCGDFLTTMLTFLFPTIGCRNFILLPWHFTRLASFSWLNVMFFDVWWTFRSLPDSSKPSSRRKYMIYSIYGWGLPLIIIGIGAIIEILPDALNGIIKPVYAGCWLIEPTTQHVYLRYPLTIMMALNPFVFIWTAISIIWSKKDAAECLEGINSRRYNDEKNRFYLYLMIFIVMGITWFDHAGMTFILTPLPQLLVSILDFASMLQGLMIFILCVCNVETKRLLSKRFGLKDRTVIQWIAYAIARIRASLTRQP